MAKCTETCPKCGSVGITNGVANYWPCGSHDRRGFFYQSDLCEAREELAAANAEIERLREKSIWGVLWEAAFDSTLEQDDYFDIAIRLERWLLSQSHRREIEDMLLSENVSIISNQGVHLLVKCSDTFYFASADAESILPEEFDGLRLAIEEAGDLWGPILWCARKRKLRPLKPHYIKMTKTQRALFDACGPEREV